MKYHAPTNQFTISAEEMKIASLKLLHVIKNIRDGARLDRTGYDNLTRESDWAEYAEMSILDAARLLGINLGARCPGKLDVSNEA